jgi:hypothetical protein
MMLVVFWIYCIGACFHAALIVAAASVGLTNGRRLRPSWHWSWLYLMQALWPITALACLLYGYRQLWREL